MLERSRRRFRNRLRQTGRAALWNENRIRTGGVRGANDSAEIMRIFDAIEKHQQFRAGDCIVVFRIAMRGAQGNHTLVSRPVGNAIERFARLKSHGDIALAA